MGQVEKICPRLFKLKKGKTMSSDNQFTALGPAAVGFQTNGANIAIGADIAGSQEGVRGRCDAGVGVSGAGGIGVKGEGDRIGVFGVGTKSGIDLTTGTGVQGESLDSNGVSGSSNLNDVSPVRLQQLTRAVYLVSTLSQRGKHSASVGSATPHRERGFPGVTTPAATLL